MEVSLTRFIFVALCLFGPVFAAINLGQFRGVPKSDTSEGNKFCFAFLNSEGSGDSADTKILGIYIATQESEPVQYRIRSGVSDVGRTGIVQPGQIKRELYRHITGNTDTDLTTTPPTIANMIPLISSDASARSINDHTGIIVETVNSSQKISVMGFSDAVGSSDGFAAVPIFNVSSIVQSYTYSIFTGGKTSGTNAQAAIVACGRIESGGMQLNYPIASPFNVLYSPAGYFMGAAMSNPSIIPFEQYYTPVITRDTEEIAGITAVSTQPIGFMTGHECGEIPQGIINCDYYVEQIPPSYTWGYNFLISPFHSRDFGYIIKIVPLHNSDADFKLFCVNASNGATVTRNLMVENFVLSQRLEADKGVFDIGEQAYCTIQSNKPIAVMQYAKGHQVDDGSMKKEQNLADPAMTWVPSAGQYLNRYLISNQVDLISDGVTNDPFTSNGVYVTVLPECFNASAILDNDTVLESDPNKWSRFYCDNLTDVCGYGISVDISIGDHLLRHADPNCAFSAIFFGWGNQKGYLYPAGFGMRPIAETFYTIEPLIPSASEGTMGPVSVTVYKSGNVSAASSVEITTVMSSSANAATIGTDLETQSSTVNFAAGHTSANATFSFLDDDDPEPFETFLVGFVQGQNINIGMPSQAELGIIDDDSVTIRFNPVTYTVTEGDSNVMLNITFVTSEPLIGESTIRITNIPTAGAANQATAGVDYMAFSQTITLPAGSTGHYYTTTILSNPEDELPEQFSATLEYVSGRPLTVTGPDATVTITDSSVITLMFSAFDYIVPENDGSVTLNITASALVTTDTVISLTGIETSGGALSSSDFGPVPATVTIPSGQSSVSFPVNIRNDVIPEPTESFDVRMALQSGQSIVVPSGTDTTTVTITDTDRSVISYSPQTVFRDEEDSPALLRIIVEPEYFETFQFESFSVQFRDQNDLAQVGVDYIAFNDTLTAVNGSGPILNSAMIINDEIMEPTEEFGVRLNVLGNARVDVAPSVDFAKVVIGDSDRISIGFREPLYVVNEPETDNRVVIVIAETRGTTARPFSVNVEFVDGSAIGGGEDYNEDPPSTISASFEAGTNRTTIIRANVLPDDIDEFTERFNLSLALGTTDPFVNRVDFFRKDTTIEIVDSDTVSFYVNTSVSTTSVPEDQNAMICVQRNGTTQRNYTVTIQPSVIPGGAQSSDFSTAPIMFLFRPTDTQVCRFVPVVDDNIALEGNESFAVSVTGTSPGVDGTPEETTTTTTEVITIIDNDVSMVFFETPRYPGEEGNTPSICLNLTKPIARPATVAITSSNTAPGLDPAESTDYSGVPSSVTFTSTSQQQCFDVTYNTDTIYEATEGATLTVNPGDSGLQPGNPISTVLEIRDSNTPTFIGEGMMIGSGMNVTVRENETATVCVSLSGSETTSTEVPITLTLTPMQKPGASDPAEPEDYDSTPKTVTISPGETRACTQIEVVEDTIDNENPEQFCVNITSDNPVIRYQPPECQIMVTIIDNIRCISYRADIMIVLDESCSIEPLSNYNLLKNFTLNLTRQFPVNETQTHIGLVRFSTPGRSEVLVQLTEFYDGVALRNRIDELLVGSDDFRGDRTYHNVSLMLAREEFNARGRSDVRKDIVLLTDGYPEPAEASARGIAAEIRAAGTDIYGVFIGNDPNRIEEIRNISTEAFPVDDFNALLNTLLKCST